MDAILFDLDGVLYVGEQPIAGAVASLQWFRAQNIPLLFITNTTSRPRNALVDKLARLGIEVGSDEIFSPAVAAARWLRSQRGGPLALFVPAATRSEFSDFDLLDPSASSGAGAVVVGDLGSQWDFATLNRAFRLLMDQPKPLLIALGMTRYWRAEDGLRLDAGAFVSALAYASSAEPRVFGKPAASFFETAVTHLGARADHTVMIGDDIRGDVAGAQAAGLKGVLVRTGKFTEADLEQGIRPDAVLDSIATLPQWWQAQAGT